MTKVKKTSFKKGESGNPNGRVKGSINKLKAASLKLREKASKDIDSAYKTLQKHMDLGEQWAHQIFFKELVPFKKEWLNEVSTAGIVRSIKGTNDISLIVTQLSNKLLEEEQVSREEIHNLIKTLNSIKLAEDFGKLKANPFEKLSDEQILTIKTMVDKANAS